MQTVATVGVDLAKQVFHVYGAAKLEGLTMLREWYLSLEQSPEVLLEQEVVRNWEPREVKIGA